MGKAIIGNGGFAREVFWSIFSTENIKPIFFVDDDWYDKNQENTLPLSKFDPVKYEVAVCIGNSSIRKKIINNLPRETRFFTHINKYAILMGDDIEIGEGSVICAGSILTTNIKIGKHSHINLNTTIGHDCIIGDYFTTAPGAHISGNCRIGNEVYIGTNASIREKINIPNNVTIGLNSGVVKNIENEGIYIGTPSKKIIYGN
jgi:sugar O-acyltransferase (sialic acid O-acetyltransferase NeuD family)